MLDIVRAAESLALGAHMSDGTMADNTISHPPKSPVEHDDKMHKTTTIVMSAHTLDTQPQVCTSIIIFRQFYQYINVKHRPVYSVSIYTISIKIAQFLLLFCFVFLFCNPFITNRLNVVRFLIFPFVTYTHTIQ